MKFPPTVLRWRACVAILVPLALAPTALAADPLPGWPVRLGASFAGFSPPTAGDIDGDGDLELVATVGDPLEATPVTEGVYAFHHDGTEVVDGDQDPGTFGVLAALDFSAGFLRGPVTLGNLDADPELEILCLGPDGVHAWNGDGKPVPGWPVALPGSAAADQHNGAPVVVADLDGDGESEVIVTHRLVDGPGTDSLLHVLTAAGAPYSASWPVTLTHSGFGATVYALVVADLVAQPGREGQLEIVATAHPTANAPHRIVAFDLEGRALWRTRFAAADVVGADMDGDGLVELVAVEVPRVEAGLLVTSLVLIEGDGEIVRRHRIELGAHLHQFRHDFPDFFERQTLGYVGAHPVNELHPDVLMLGRIDADELPDVVVATRYLDQTAQSISGSDELFTNAHRSAIHAIDLARGTVFPGFPFEFDHTLPGGEAVTSPERLIDVDGDGRVELLASALPSNFEKRLHVWDASGAELYSDSLFATTPGQHVLELVLRRGILGDFDRDGVLDLATALRRGELHVVRLSGPGFTPPYVPRYGWTQYRGDAQRTGVWRE